MNPLFDRGLTQLGLKTIIQSGVTTLTGKTSTETINSVSDKAVVDLDCIHLENNGTVVSNGEILGNDYFVKGVVSSDSLILSRGYINEYATLALVRWKVIDFIGAKRVQKGDASFNDNQTIDVTIQACNTTKSLIYFSCSSESYLPFYYSELHAYFTNTTTLTFFKHSPLSAAMSIRWYVVEL